VLRAARAAERNWNDTDQLSRKKSDIAFGQSGCPKKPHQSIASSLVDALA
jgi:hypothetical protein